MTKKIKQVHDAGISLQHIENQQLKQITGAIISFIQPEKLICFSSKIQTTETKSCFSKDTKPFANDTINRYCLFLVPSAEERLHNFVIQQKAEELCRSIATVVVLVHRMEEINQALENGSTFFTGIYKKGLLLYDRDEQPFVVPGEGSPVNKRIAKREKFWEKFASLSANFLKGAVFFVNEKSFSLAVFMLHQAVIHSYAGSLKVLTGYKTGTHSLHRLINIIDTTLPDSGLVLPKNTPEDARLISILSKGYADARYHDKFETTEEEVKKLLEYVTGIAETANKVCSERILLLKEGKIPYKA